MVPKVVEKRRLPCPRIVSAAECRNDRLAKPRVTINGASQASVTGNRTPARASFSSQISTYAPWSSQTERR